MNRIVDEMFSRDLFSQWLDIRRIQDEPGHCILEMVVRPEMVNGFGIAHGGITYCLADSALAFASNAHGRKAVSIETSVNHLLPVRTGDVLRAKAEEISRSNRIALYQIRITRDQETVAYFKGLVYIKDENWEIN